MELLQPGPLVDRPAQIQNFDGVVAEHQLAEVAGRPESRAGQSSDAVGSHVHRAQAGHVEEEGRVKCVADPH